MKNDPCGIADRDSQAFLCSRTSVYVVLRLIVSASSLYNVMRIQVTIHQQTCRPLSFS